MPRPVSSLVLARVREEVVDDAHRHEPLVGAEPPEVVEEQRELSQFRLRFRGGGRSLGERGAHVKSRRRERRGFEQRLTEVREDPRGLDGKGCLTREKTQQLHVIGSMTTALSAVKDLDDTECAPLTFEWHRHD